MKQTDEPGFHIPGSCHGVGHGEDTLRGDAFTVEHVPQPGDQHGGLAAPRHSQQQDRAIRLADGLLLLPVQPDWVLTFELLVGHGRLLCVFIREHLSRGISLKSEIPR